MDRTISCHLPIITPRIEFTNTNSIRLLPIITPRINFALEWTESLHLAEHDDTDSIAAASDNSPDDATLGSEMEDQDDITDLDKNKKILKPPGEPGRLNSGGYNIDNELRGWTLALIADVNQFIKQKADEHLDIGQSYSKQRAADVTSVCLMVKKQFPVVEKYDNCWPVRDMLKLYLRYMAEKEQKEGAASKEQKGVQPISPRE
ncbi:unnamed protein product [Cyclocybe aegerita]|uniref:Uncharacterized protein n=1 Tax=Cyclocybe aegerita TaxID=1973307 RepID=A0A8S0W0L4_CYCAE|nr:unnamed protein product [Cyclocybe aegerita]